MSLQDFQKLQRELHALHLQKASLSQQNASQRTQLQVLSARVAELQSLANNQPIRLITQHLDPLALASTLLRLEDKITAQTYELSFLQQLAEDKSVLLADAHRRAAELELHYEEAKLQGEILAQQVREAAARDERARKEAEGWRARLEKSNQDHLRTVSEKQELGRQLKREQNKNHNVLLDLAKQVTSIRETTNTETTHSRDRSDFQSIESLARSQQEELHQRNEEIARLKAINGNQGESGQQHLKNTIKHLRGELSRYSNLIQHVTDKLALAEATILRYSTSADKCNQELASVDKLNERIFEQAMTIKSLEEDVRAKTEQLQKERRAKLENKKVLVEALKENQCFHTFLYDTYGDSLQDLIMRERKTYEERLNARKQREKWVTVEELVETNQHLRARLKIA